jgi:methionine-S-sulfoxide reductase
MKKAYFAGGCFWCVEHDLAGASGVHDVVSGYVSTEQQAMVPTHERHTGFREAVQVTYDPTATSFKKLVQFFLDHIDPTDGDGQFADRGESYKTAVYYQEGGEADIIQALLTELDASGVYDKPVVVDVLPFAQFYPAEEYHQDYSEKNPVHYGLYREGSGRARFVNRTCQIREAKSINWR